MARNIEAYFFDFDGTLQEGDKLEVDARFTGIVRDLKLKLSPEEIKQIIISTPDYREMRKAAVDLHNTRAEKQLTEDDFQAANNKLSGSFDHMFYLSPWTREIMLHLGELGYDRGLVTTRGGTSLPRLLDETHGIRHYFDVVVCREDVQKRKPDPEPLYVALGKLNELREKRGVPKLEPRQVAYVGDSFTDDVGAAKNAGMLPIWKSDLGLNGEGVKQHDSHYQVRNLQSLQALVKQLA